MRIAYVYDAVYPYVKGGAEKRVYEIGKRLAERGHEVHWYGMKCWENGDVLESDGITMHGVCPRMPLYAKNGRRSIKEAVYFAAKLYRPLAREKYDVIDCQHFPYLPCLTCEAVATTKKTPLALTWHEIWGNYWRTYMGYPGYAGEEIERICARLTRNNITVSEKNRERLESMGMDGERIKVIPNGIDPGEIGPVKKTAGGYDVLFAGRLIKDKNVDVLINAVKLASMEIPDISLGIIGEGPEKNRLQALAEETGAKVEFLGFRKEHDEVISYLKSSKIFALPSTREGFGIVGLEALACGLPIITTEHPLNAAGDLITNGLNGYKGPLSKEYFAEKIASLLGDEALRKKMSLKAEESIVGHSWDMIAKDTEGYYESIADAR
jgi:glycosyltransferase involved in cell wall biosynthesis